jgi:hypothetical protein
MMCDHDACECYRDMEARVADLRAQLARAERIEEALREHLQALKEYWKQHGIWHEDDCPEDDTCECRFVVAVMQTEEIARAALSAPREDAQAPRTRRNAPVMCACHDGTPMPDGRCQTCLLPVRGGSVAPSPKGCERCGWKLDPHYLICRNCGTSLLPPPREDAHARRCEKAGHGIEPTDYPGWFACGCKREDAHARDERLRSLGFEDPTPEHRADNLAANLLAAGIAPVGGSVAPSPKGCERCGGTGGIERMGARATSVSIPIMDKCPACQGSGESC